MPYIDPVAREVATHNPVSEGELNYAIHKLIQAYIRMELQYHAENYKMWNGIVGVLECVKQEIYRRKIAPYEDAKMRQNGDVWENEGAKNAKVTTSRLDYHEFDRWHDDGGPCTD